MHKPLSSTRRKKPLSSVSFTVSDWGTSIKDATSLPEFDVDKANICRMKRTLIELITLLPSSATEADGKAMVRLALVAA